MNLRHLKTTMQLDVLRGRSPDIVRKEVFAHLLAYNLIRSLLWQAAKTHGEDPLRLSVKGAIQHMTSFAPLICTGAPAVAKRLVKRRPKWTRWLKEPRQVIKRRMVG